MKPQSSPKPPARRPPRKVERVAVAPADRRAREVEGTPHPGLGALPHQLTQLAQEYALLARERVASSVDSAEVLGLALWGFDVSESAFVLVRDGVIALSNHRYHELRCPLAGSTAWNRLEDAAEPDGPFAHLDELVLRRAAATPAGGASGPVRFLRAGRDQVIDVRTERSQLSSGGGAAVLVSITDVTEQVRLEQEVSYARRVMADQERVRLLGEVTSGVAHDLKNMLAAMALRLAPVSGAATPPCDERAVGVLRRIVDDGMTTLTRLQEFARRGVMDPPLDKVDVRQTVHDALEMVDTELRHAAVARGGRAITVETQLPELPPVRGAAVELRQLFMNLLLNARDALADGGTIRISAALAGDTVQVLVEDDGPGIPEPLLEKVFLPFFSTKGERGNGMGLFTAANAMKRLGGSITAQNREGGGAQFCLLFPVAELRAGCAVIIATAAQQPLAVPAAAPVLEPPPALDTPLETQRRPSQPVQPTQLQLSPARSGPRTL